MLGIRNEPGEGKLRVSYAQWDEVKVIEPGECLILRSSPQGVQAFVGFYGKTE
jgi:hypothetical protein